MENDQTIFSPDMSTVELEIGREITGPSDNRSQKKVFILAALAVFISSVLIGLWGYFLGSQFAVFQKNQLDSYNLSNSNENLMPITDTATLSSQLITYTSPTQKFTLKYPNSWEFRISENGYSEDATYFTNKIGDEEYMTFEKPTDHMTGEIKHTKAASMRGPAWKNLTQVEFFDPHSSFWITGKGKGGGPGTDHELPQKITIAGYEAMMQRTNPSTQYEWSYPEQRTDNYYFYLGGPQVNILKIDVTYDSRAENLQTNLEEFNTILASLVLTSDQSSVQKVLLSDVLSKYCLDSKIALDSLPFRLTSSLKNDYKLENTVICFVPEQNFASISIATDFTNSDRSIYFFHKGSVWQGMVDNFQSLENYIPITIDEKTYYLEVMEPGPYGISTYGVWVRIIGEKTDSESGTIVRAVDFEVLSSQEFIDLVKKYGEKYPDSDGPEYSIGDSVKKAQFLKELATLAESHSAFKNAAQNVTADLNGVSF